MFTDMPLDRYIRALLDRPPNRRTGYITKLSLEELRFFIAGEDHIAPDIPPLIVRLSLSPIPNVAMGDIQQELWRLQNQGLVGRLGRWYAWSSVATRRTRLKAAVYAPVLALRLRRLQKRGAELLARPVPDRLLLDTTRTQQGPPTTEADGP